jgi:signal transduction histidine kinase
MESSARFDPDDPQRSAAEQAALRRVATLVARGAAAAEVFEALVTEVGLLTPATDAALVRLHSDETVTMIGRWNEFTGYQSIGVQHPFGDGTLARLIWDSKRPSRVTTYRSLSGPLADMIKSWGWRSSVGAPVVVNAEVWGLTAVGSTNGDIAPPGTEERLAAFTELLASAIANAQSREEIEQLADEQAALLRVAEQVARGGPADAVFASVAAEAQQLLGGQPMTLVRFEDDAALTVLSRSGGPAPPGTRIDYSPGTLPDRVRRTARAVRVDDYAEQPDAGLARQFGLAAAVAAPIAVDREVWGMLTATSADAPLTPGIEDRLQRFANLVGTAVANATSRAQLVASRERVLSTADETRRRIQRDVHDGAQQRLVHTVMILKLARRSLAAGDLAISAERVEEALKQAQLATAELRELVSGILPAALTRTGLRGGVESLLADLPLPVDADIDVPRLAVEVETTAYFVVAEALTNVVKHARAGRAWVVAGLAGESLRVAVGDDVSVARGPGRGPV